MMQSLKLSSFSILICVSAIFVPYVVVSDKLLMSVFYQSYGPESFSLVRKQVYPVYTKLSDQIQFDLVPYGNANTTILPNGTITFSCQYGPKGCNANKLHACALAHLEPQDAVPFIICMMSQKVPVRADISCALALNVSYVNVDLCVRSREGDLLLAANGVRTRRDPNITHAHGYYGWKPKVFFNNQFDEEVIQKRGDNLFDAARSYLKSKRGNCKKRAGTK